jgi:hypothetical protein
VHANFAWAQGQVAQSLTLAQQAGRALAARGDLWREAEVIWTIPWSLYFLGRAGEADRELAEFAAKTERIGHQGARWVVRHARATMEAARGEIEAAVRTAIEAEAIGRQAGLPWVYHTLSFIATMAIWQGREAEGLPILRKVAEIEQPRNYWYPSSRAHLFGTLAHLAPDEARAWHSREPIALAIDGTRAPAGVWTAVGGLTEAYARLGLKAQVLELAPHVDELYGRGAIIHGGWMTCTTTVAGIAAWYRDRWADAEKLLQLAVEQMDTIPVRHKSGQAREWYAEMLLARDDSGDRDRARTLLAEAREIYARLGFEGLLRRVKTID